VTVVQGPGSGKKIQVPTALYIPQLGAARMIEGARERACVRLHIGFEMVEDIFGGHGNILHGKRFFVKNNGVAEIAPPKALQSSAPVAKDFSLHGAVNGFVMPRQENPRSYDQRG
jgi:hypothetical protein